MWWLDHAGKWETSLMLGTHPENVDLSLCKNREWFAQRLEASEELANIRLNRFSSGLERRLIMVIHVLHIFRISKEI